MHNIIILWKLGAAINNPYNNANNYLQNIHLANNTPSFQWVIAVTSGSLYLARNLSTKHKTTWSWFTRANYESQCSRIKEYKHKSGNKWAQKAADVVVKK